MEMYLLILHCLHRKWNVIFQKIILVKIRILFSNNGSEKNINYTQANSVDLNDWTTENLISVSKNSKRKTIEIKTNWLS